MDVRSLWTAAPHEDGWSHKDAPAYPRPSSPQAPDNAAERKVLVYGPKGEALIVQQPRPVGFRVRPR